MRREDDFEKRREHLRHMSQDELGSLFWELAFKVTEPLIELARSHTSPSLERSVLLRMGCSSLEADAVVDGCIQRGVLGWGAGNLLLRLQRTRGLSTRAAARLLISDPEVWSEATGLLDISWKTIESGRPPEPPPSTGGALPGRGETGGGKKWGDSQGGETQGCEEEGCEREGGTPAPPDPMEKLDVPSLLQGLESYRPRRSGWTWRTALGAGTVLGPFDFRQVSSSLERSVALPAAHWFGDIDPQPDCVLTTEIASGRFEDDLRRMRMAAWHGADHIMVIRTAGQSHFDGLIEGTPEGVGGVPITRKQLRCTRRALDLIEDEVGRPINLHSYVSGLAGPEMAVLFAEEGVNGAHQDPQYNVLYRNINMFRSFVDAAEAKHILAGAGVLQIDGAHNANATAREAWKVTPELLVQHAINSAYSIRAGMPRDLVALSTVPPTAPPAPCIRMDLPYALALRELFDGFRLRAQMNTRYIGSSTREATVTHVLNLLITRLCGAHIQSTITPDEGRNIPWHHNSVNALDTARQALAGMDGLDDLLEIRWEGVRETVRRLEERAVLFLEEILELGGYFAAVKAGLFVDSGFYPERRGDGISRSPGAGVAAGTIVRREPSYMAPVCGHFGANRLPSGVDRPCRLLGGCTLCEPGKIVFVDELDESDNVNARLASRDPAAGIVPEVQWAGDGGVTLAMMLPAGKKVALAAAEEIGKRLGLLDVQVIHSEVMHPAEGTFLEVRATLPFAIRPEELSIPPDEPEPDPDTIRDEVARQPMAVVAATVGEDEHSVGMREVIDIKHGGLEAFGFECHYLGTSVPVTKLVDAAMETGAAAILISTIITHADIHRLQMRKLHGTCVEKGVRDKLILVAGGTQVTCEVAVECGMDAGFGRGTRGVQVADFLVRHRRELLSGRRGTACGS